MASRKTSILSHLLISLSPRGRGETPTRVGVGEGETSNQAFTLIEILVVLGIFIFLAALGLFMSMDVYRGNSLHAEKNIVVSVLQKARSRAMNNINESKHGVHFEPGRYILFEGDVYAPSANPEDIPATTNVTTTSTADIIFDQLTGNATCSPAPATPPCTVTLTGDAKAFSITINSAGGISWD